MKDNNQKFDVISLNWATSPDRDQAMATLICNYLQMQGVNLYQGSVYDGFNILNTLKPKLLFLMNPVGALENVETMRYANARGCLGVSLVSEGIFQGSDRYQKGMIWGWNSEEKLYEKIQLQWSQRTKDITTKFYPDIANRISICGGVGFDNYKISNKSSFRESLLNKYGKGQFKRVVGVGCFNFDWFYPFDKGYQMLIKEAYSEDVIERFRRDGIDFDRELSALARECTDTLFLVKFHPNADTGHQAAATEGMKNLPNTLFIHTEEPIMNCIGASDVWIVYESTTAIEADLMGVPCCHLNPSGRDFPRAVVHQGYPVYHNKNELAAALNEFYESGCLLGYAELKSARAGVIEQTIGWDDGLNHVRAGNAIIDLLESSPTPVWIEESTCEKLLRWKQHVMWLVGPFIRRYDRFLKSAANRHLFSMPELHRYRETKMAEQQAYYDKMGLSLSDLRQIKSLK